MLDNMPPMNVAPDVSCGDGVNMLGVVRIPSKNCGGG